MASILGEGKMRLITVRHITAYRYKQPVSFGEHRMMLRPRDSYDQKLIEMRLDITPEPASLRWVHDVFGNCVAIARFSGRAIDLGFDSTIRLDHSPSNALEFQIEDYASTYPFSYGSEESPDLLRSIERQYLDADREIDRWARQFLRRQGPTGTRELLAAMTHARSARMTQSRH
jgi:transglutaminase-like putative cysteine protease